EPIRHLEQDAGSVAGGGLAAARPAMEEILQDRQRLRDDGVGLPALDVHDEADATRVVLVPGVVEALRGRKIRTRHHHPRLARQPARKPSASTRFREGSRVPTISQAESHKIIALAVLMKYAGRHEPRDPQALLRRRPPP